MTYERLSFVTDQREGSYDRQKGSEWRVASPELGRGGVPHGTGISSFSCEGRYRHL